MTDAVMHAMLWAVVCSLLADKLERDGHWGPAAVVGWIGVLNTIMAVVAGVVGIIVWVLK